MVKKTKVGILGGGLSGLTCAYLLKEKNIEVQVFERSHRTGGAIGSKIDSGFLIEYGANSFLNNEPKTMDLIKSLGLEAQLVKAKQEAADRYVYVDKMMHKIPLSPKDFLKSNLLNLKTKFNVWRELKFPPKVANNDQRTLFDFAKDH
jgi:oxygen-dependent protoporphyrinogen oxidase